MPKNIEHSKTQNSLKMKQDEMTELEFRK